MSIMIIDYGMGNLKSVRRAFEECGAEVFVSSNPKDIKKASKIVLPGVGSFKDGIINLKRNGFFDVIIESCSVGNKPILGICLGMQMLADKGYENGESDGLGLVPGSVIKLETQSDKYRIPHVGWNEVDIIRDDVIVNDVPNRADFYFVHSYHFVCKNDDNVVAVTPYCQEITSIVQKDTIWGVQFHPEKSHKYGFKIIKNFINL